MVLKTHSIPPHWMFALDDLVRSAAKSAIEVLSPGMYHTCLLASESLFQSQPNLVQVANPPISIKLTLVTQELIG